MIEEPEIKNIEICMKTGYDKAILYVPEKRALEKLKALVFQRLKESEEKFFF